MKGIFQNNKKSSIFFWQQQINSHLPLAANYGTTTKNRAIKSEKSFVQKMHTYRVLHKSLTNLIESYFVVHAKSSRDKIQEKKSWEKI